MTSREALKTILRRDPTIREQAIAFLSALLIAGALVYQYPYRAVMRSVNAVAADIEAARQDLGTVTAQYEDLKAHEAEIRSGLMKAVSGRDLADKRGVVLFLDDVSSEAQRHGVNLIAVHPAKEVEKDHYKEVSLNLDLKGRYRALAEYFRQLENLSRIVNIRKIRVEACPDSSSACATQLEAVTYLEK
jgi:Tfp pilus assembly protein PilO